MADQERGEVLRVSRSLLIPLDEVEVRTSTPGGPGGQHANRSQTRVEVTFDIAGSDRVGPRQRARLLERLGPVARASAADSRSQARNRELAIERLTQKLAAALHVPTARVPTRPSRASKAKRLDAKRHQAERKADRRRPPSDA